MLVSYEFGRESMRFWAIGIFIVAAVTDALDGILARVLKQKTPIGQMLDPVADKFLLLSGYIGLLFVTALPYKPPLWITVAIIFRDIVLAFGFFTLSFMAVKVDYKPNWLGKGTTVFQMLLLILVLLEWPLAVPVAYMTAALTVASGIVYIFKGLKLIP